MNRYHYLNRAFTATMALDKQQVIVLRSAINSILWAMEYLDKPLAADQNDKGYADIVEKYFIADIKRGLLGLEDFDIEPIVGRTES